LALRRTNCVSVEPDEPPRGMRLRTLRYSLEASCHSLVMVGGGGPANDRMAAKRMKLAARPANV